MPGPFMKPLRGDWAREISGNAPSKADGYRNCGAANEQTRLRLLIRVGSTVKRRTTLHSFRKQFQFCKRQNGGSPETDPVTATTFRCREECSLESIESSMRIGVRIAGVPLLASMAFAQIADVSLDKRHTFSRDVAPIFFFFCVS